MVYEKQVDKSHYAFASYMTKPRWCSVWHQLSEIQKVNPENLLKIGSGSGMLKNVAATFGMAIETLDLDPELNPDHVASVTAMPFADAAYDVVCAFQVLEHLPYDTSILAFREMARVSGRHVLISLPDAQQVWRYQFPVPRPQLSLPVHVPDREHFWEINKRGYRLSRVVADFAQYLPLIRTFRVPENPYHRFFVFAR